MIVKSVNDSNDFAVTAKQVRKVLKHEMGFRYLKSKKLHPNANSVRVLVQR